LNIYLKKQYDNLLLVSLICHGPTSPLVHKQFCEELENKYNSKLSNISVRYKRQGWKPYYIKADFEDGNTYLEKFQDTDYEMAFQYLKRPSCSSCPFKLFNKEHGIQSDMIIGDFHYAHHGMIQYNKWGSSQISALTEKGQTLLVELNSLFNLYPITEKEATHYNIALIQPIPQKLFRSQFSKVFAKNSLHAASSLVVVKLEKNIELMKGRILYRLAIISRPIRQKLTKLFS